MSKMINKLDQNNSRKRATIATVYASTPVKSISAKNYNISLSGIDTASSSDGGRNLQLLISDLVTTRKRSSTRKKREDGKWRIKESDSELEAKQKQFNDKFLKEKRKKNLKSKKRPIKAKQILKDTESEWETEPEKSIIELSRDSRGSILNDNKYIKLFEDPCTPEKTRDISSAYEEILHTHKSPIIGSSSRRSSYLISKEKDIILQDTLLPMNPLPMEIRNLEETDEDETLFQCNTKTRVPLRKSEKSPKQKSANFNFSIQFPTTTNNLRRNQSVKTYPAKIFRHSASSSPQTSIKLKDITRKLPKVSKKTESVPIPPGMTRVSGYWNKTLRKWQTYEENSSHNELENNKRKTKTSKRNMNKFTRKQKYDVYDEIDKTDNEFETGGQSGKRMSFHEFCLKQKKVKIISFSDTEED